MTDDITALVERISARLKSASSNDRRYERPMTWDEANELVSALTAAQARIERLETELRLTASTAGTFQTSAESALIRLAEVEKERDEQGRNAVELFDEAYRLRGELERAEKERDAWRNGAENWRKDAERCAGVAAQHIDRALAAEKERDAAREDRVWLQDHLKAALEERDAARAALMDRIRDDNGCTPAYLEQTDACDGWNATHCGCAEEARATLSDHQTEDGRVATPPGYSASSRAVPSRPYGLRSLAQE